MIEFCAILMALAIGYVVWLHRQATIDNATERREALRRQYEAARKRHGASRDIQRKLVRATTDQIKQECGA